MLAFQQKLGKESNIWYDLEMTLKVINQWNEHKFYATTSW